MIVVSDWDDCWKYKLSVGYFVGSSSYCEFVACSSAGSLWVNYTDPRLVDFNKMWNLFNIFLSSSNSLSSEESDYITSFKSANSFESVSRFTGDDIWKPLVSIQSNSSLTRSVKYAEHIWIGHACSLYGSLVDSCKNLSNISSGLRCMSIKFLYFRYCLIIEIWQHKYLTLDELSTESCPT